MEMKLDPILKRTDSKLFIKTPGIRNFRNPNRESQDGTGGYKFNQEES
jgi:hypothetical protein